MENKTKLVKIEPVMTILYDADVKKFIGTLEVSKDCVGFDAVKNVLVSDESRLRVFAQLEESINALKRVLVVEKIVRTRKTTSK